MRKKVLSVPFFPKLFYLSQTFAYAMLSFSKYSLSLLILISSFFISSFAQEQDYKWGIGLQINTVDKPPLFNGVDIYSPIGNNGPKGNYSFSAGLNLDYKFKKDRTFRFNASYTRYMIIGTEQKIWVPTGELIYDSLLFWETTINLAPGISWARENENLNWYGGFEIPVNIHGKYKEHGYTYSTLTNVAIENWTISGGYSSGIGSFAGLGVNPFKSKKISICAEFSFRILYTHVGGIGSYDGKNIDPTTGAILWSKSDSEYPTDKFDGFNFYPFKGAIIFKYNFN